MSSTKPHGVKRFFITTGRIMVAGSKNFVRNTSLAIAAIAVMVITLTIVLFSVIASSTFSNTIKQITDKIDISVYLKDTVTVEQRDEFIASVKKIHNVREVKYLSKDDALAAYRAQNAQNIDLLLAVSETENPLPASLQIKPKDPNKIAEIRNFLEQPERKNLQSDETSYSGDRKEAVDKITQAASFLRKAGIVGVIIFTITSVMIIFNTIQMAIFNRREELTIMRLLGANTWFIRGPFVFEAMLYGVVSALISIAACKALFVVQASALNASSLGLLDVSFANSFFVGHFWLILIIQIGIGILIGVASSIIATRRYLKFKTTK